MSAAPAGKKRGGVEDIFSVCVDGLSGSPQAIEAVYPKAEIRKCVIHGKDEEDARVGHESPTRAFSGYKNHIAMTEDRLITGAADIGSRNIPR